MHEEADEWEEESEDWEWGEEESKEWEEESQQDEEDPVTFETLLPYISNLTGQDFDEEEAPVEGIRPAICFLGVGRYGGGDRERLMWEILSYLNRTRQLSPEEREHFRRLLYDHTTTGFRYRTWGDHILCQAYRDWVGLDIGEALANSTPGGRKATLEEYGGRGEKAYDHPIVDTHEEIEHDPMRDELAPLLGLPDLIAPTPAALCSILFPAEDHSGEVTTWASYMSPALVDKLLTDCRVLAACSTPNSRCLPPFAGGDPLPPYHPGFYMLAKAIFVNESLFCYRSTYGPDLIRRVRPLLPYPGADDNDPRGIECALRLFDPREREVVLPRKEALAMVTQLHRLRPFTPERLHEIALAYFDQHMRKLDDLLSFIDMGLENMEGLIEIAASNGLLDMVVFLWERGYRPLELTVGTLVVEYEWQGLNEVLASLEERGVPIVIIEPNRCHVPYDRERYVVVRNEEGLRSRLIGMDQLKAYRPEELLVKPAAFRGRS
jgi:hypothetical protein